MGIRFLANNLAISWPVGLTFFMVTQETIIYRLVMINPGFGIGVRDFVKTILKLELLLKHCNECIKRF